MARIPESRPRRSISMALVNSKDVQAYTGALRWVMSLRMS
jgi:hypothetical protein